MGSKERRDREREDTRRRIIDAARTLFVEQGYEATTMRAIADRLEFTPTALYHHFRNKEALMGEMVLLDSKALAQAFLRIGRIEDPIERLERIGAAYVDFALERPMHYRLMFMTVRPPDNELSDQLHADPSEDAYAFLRSACQEAINRGRFDPAFTDADEIAQMLWAAVHGLVSLHIVKGHDPWIDFRDVRKTSARMRTAIVRGLFRH